VVIYPRVEPNDPGSRALAAGLLEAAPDAIFVVRGDGKIALTNPVAERLFGYERSELIGQPIEMLMPEAQRSAHKVSREDYQSRPSVRAMGEPRVLYGRSKRGELIPVEISLSPMDSTSGRVTIAIVRDVSRRLELEARLRYASTHDALTGLFNRTHLDAERPRLEAEATPLGVIIVDVDELKPVNDRLGHEAGDEVLRDTASVLRAASDATDLVVRLGGDEFAIVRPRCSEAALQSLIVRLQLELARHNEQHGHRPLRLSLGAARTKPGGSLALAMRLSDERMYAQKREHASQRPPAAPPAD
jgi:diguanylate cyclase (GGDEF)-like protein/PAS domain S-box-containing protein